MTPHTEDSGRSAGTSRTRRLAVFRQVPVFSGLSDGELGDLANVCTERRLAANEFVFWEGDPPERFYIVASGQVKVVKHSDSGKEFIVAFFTEGEVFGEVAVFEDRPYPASAQAVVDSRVLGIEREAFLSFLGRHPVVALKIISLLGGRLREAQSRLRDLAIEKVEQRLANALLMLSSKVGPTLPFTRQEIAAMTGTTTETVIRIVSRFKERGIVRTARGRLTIVDREKLRVLGEGQPLVV